MHRAHIEEGIEENDLSENIMMMIDVNIISL